jgi:hypothetical protein
VRDEARRESWEGEMHESADPNSDLERYYLRSRLTPFEVCSLVIVCSLCAVGMVAFAAFYLLFVALIVIDGTATFFAFNAVISVDRSILFIGLTILSTLSIPNLLLLTVETLVLFAILDISFFLRRVADTRVETSVLKRRLQSYVYTMVPAFLLTYALISLFSILPIGIIPPSSALFVLSASSAGAFVTVWLAIHYVSSFLKAETIPEAS